MGHSISKPVFYKGAKNEVNKKPHLKYVLWIAVILLISALAFNMLILIRQSLQPVVTKMSMPIVILLSIYLFGTYIFAVKGFLQVRKQKSLIYFSYRIICMSGAIVNIVLLQRMILSLTTIAEALILEINSVFGYFTGGIMFLMAFILIGKYFYVKRKTVGTEKQ